MLSLLLLVGCRTSVKNQFFFPADQSSAGYQVEFEDVETIELISKEADLYIEKINQLEDGAIYHLYFDGETNIPLNNLNLGNFYVMKDKIYKLNCSDEDIEKIKSSSDIPSGSSIVCNEQEVKDPLSENERGWHESIDVDDETRSYHGYSTQTETGYYESFVWEKGVGLIEYRSGYGAGREFFEMKLC